jgi:hypothetical protein
MASSSLSTGLRAAVGTSRMLSRSTRGHDFGGVDIFPERLGQPSIQKRRIHVAYQGSGVSPEEQSTIQGLQDAYEGPFKVMIGGPGTGPHASILEMGGVFHTEAGFQGRLQQGLDAIAEAVKAGDREIHLAGFSRGTDVMRATAQHLNDFGLQDRKTGEQLLPAGTPVHSVTAVDPVTAGPIPGYGTRLTGDRSLETVPDTMLTMPPNVQFFQQMSARDEKREAFHLVNMPPESSETEYLHQIMPGAVHSDVGGKPGRNEAARALALSETLRPLVAKGFGFSSKGIVSDEEYNELLDHLQTTPAKRGRLEAFTAWLLGEKQRTFDPAAQELRKRPTQPEDQEPISTSFQ